MSKKKRGETPSRRRDAAVQTKADRMVQRLRHNHELGRQALRDERAIADFAAEHGIAENTMRRFKAFAAAYSRSELAHLCGLRRPNALSLQFGHVIYLLIVDDPAARKKLAERAAREGWSAPQMNAAISRPSRTGKGHGRTMQIPSSPEAALQQLVDEAGRWQRRAELVVAAVERRTVKGVSGCLRDAVAEAIAEIERLERVARTAKKRLSRVTGA